MAVKIVVDPRVNDFWGSRVVKGKSDASGGMEVGGGERRAEGCRKAAPDSDPREMDHRCLTQGCCS